MKPISYTYTEFKEVWTQLLNDKQASLNKAIAILGGSKNTASKYRLQFEMEKKDEALLYLNEVELPKVVTEALADISVKKVKALEAANADLKKHLIDAELNLEELTKSLQEAQQAALEQDEAMKAKTMTYEKEVAVLNAQMAERDSAQGGLQAELNAMREQLSAANTDAAVAKKEVELLKAQLAQK